MEKKLYKKIIVFLVCIEIVSLLFITGASYQRAQRSVYANMEQILTQESEFYSEIKKIQDTRLSYYANDYITRVSAIEYMLAVHPEVRSAAHLQYIRTLFDVEGIYALDMAGTVIWSSEPAAVGTALLHNEAAAPFWEVLQGTGEQVLFNSDCEEILEYAPGMNYLALRSQAVPCAMVLIGIDKEIATELLEDSSTAGLLRYVPTTKNESLFAVDKETGEIIGESWDNAPMLRLDVFEDGAALLETLEDAEQGRMVWLHDKFVFMKIKPVEDIILVDLRSSHTQFDQLLNVLFISVASLTVFLAAVFAILRRHFRRYVFDEINGIQQDIERLQAGEEDVVFHTSYGTEMRAITDALNDWNSNIRRTQHKLDWILAALHSNEAMFEYLPYVNKLYCSDNFQEVMGLDDTLWNSLKADPIAFVEYIRQLSARKNKNEIVKLNDKFLRIELSEMEQESFGIIIDKTEEIRQQKVQSSALRQLEDASRLDSLTGLLNRRGFEASVELVLAEGHPYTVLLIFDVDNFKQVNDTFGHPEGDCVLQQVALAIQRQFRKDDVLTRLGGDEFAVLLNPGMPLVTLERKLEHMMESLRNDMAEANHQISISIGAVWTAQYTGDYGQLYQCADEALYEAKRAGKNKYAIHIY